MFNRVHSTGCVGISRFRAKRIARERAFNPKSMPRAPRAEPMRQGLKMVRDAQTAPLPHLWSHSQRLMAIPNTGLLCLRRNGRQSMSGLGSRLRSIRCTRPDARADRSLFQEGRPCARAGKTGMEDVRDLSETTPQVRLSRSRRQAECGGPQPRPQGKEGYPGSQDTQSAQAPRCA